MEPRGANPENADQSVHVSPFPPADWRLAQTTRANLLLIGMDGATDEILEAIRRDSPESIPTWRSGERLVLPPVAHPGTMLLHDVGALTLDDQHRLLDWLEGSAGRARVVSTTSATLLPLVENGVFLDTLYYRLNTVCFVRAE